MRFVAFSLLLSLGASWGVQADPLPGAPPPSRELAAKIEATLAAQDSTVRPRTRHLELDGHPRFTNRLILEQSPYLQQHAHNPVNWYSWGEEAFAAARALGRPVFLSVGYSTCHWCHVMEEESFEDLEVAEFLNLHFVAITVDREERPDIDSFYMAAVRTMTGRGGWPLTAFLTPEGRPFYGGTYFPPRDGMRGRRKGLMTVMRTIQTNYADDPTRTVAESRSLVESLARELDPPPAVGAPSADELRRALATYRRRFDTKHGGVRSRTKFPSSLPIPLLLRAHRRTGQKQPLEMARKTLDSMRKGGLYDHIGGGFHRYTVDSAWTVPHFEKMLYDNALLSLTYTSAYQVTGDPLYAEVVRDTLDYLSREMSSPEGMFYAATDADSEGEEGKFFVWTPGEVGAAVGDELAPLALAAYGVTNKGNFEGGRTVLRRDAPEAQLAARFGLEPEEVRGKLREIRRLLRAARAKRIPPDTDRKQIVGWNGLAISAFARAGLVLREEDLIERGARAARSILSHALPEGRLARYVFDGRPYGTGMLDDHAFLIAALLDLFEATAEALWLDRAVDLQKDLDRRFFDEMGGGYYRTPSDGEGLLIREKPADDGAVPSGNSVEAFNLLRLALFTTDESYRIHAEMTLRAFSELLEKSPTAFSRMLEAVDLFTDRPKEILVVTPHSRNEAEPFLAELVRVYLPNHILVVAPETEIRGLVTRIPLLKQKRALGGKPTAYVCENEVCDLPARDVPTFAKQIRTKPAPYPVDGVLPPR